jgi:DNA-binding NarL/FixJ family response regulator
MSVAIAAKPVIVAVLGADPLVSEGTVAYLRSRPGIRPVPASEAARADVVLVMATQVTEETLAQLKDVAERCAGRELRCVLVGDGIGQSQLLRAVTSGVVTVLPRQDADYGRIVRAILRAHAGLGDMPAQAVGWLSSSLRVIHNEVLAPNGLTAHGLQYREVEVLRLLADGLETAEIAARLNYSERTVKNIIHGLLTRLRLRNRSHAVAYALRNGAL